MKSVRAKALRQRASIHREVFVIEELRGKPRQAVGNRKLQSVKRLAEYSEQGAMPKPEFLRGNLRKDWRASSIFPPKGGGKLAPSWPNCWQTLRAG
jgi:hypothetical protein